MLEKRTTALLGLTIVLAGSAFALLGEQVLVRFERLEGNPSDRIWLMWGFGIGLSAFGISVMTETREGQSQKLGLFLIYLAAIGSFLAFALQLSSWWIDDAGITFSYSRSLAEGYGITYQPGQEPTEGYSSSLWMLILACFGVVGVDIPTAAKSLGLLLGLATLVVSMRVVWLISGSAIAVSLAFAALATAPFVVWSASGQEHAIQAFILVMIVYSAHAHRAWRSWSVVLLSLFVLARPEAPIIVASVFGTMVVSDAKDGIVPALRKNLPLALVPFVVFFTLIAWRLYYFGDALPNPYYAKTASSSLSGVLNPFGGGWTYVVDGLRDSALLVLLVLPLLYRVQQTEELTQKLLLAILLSHLFFVIWAKGDWMGQYRFLMPIIPLIAIAATPTVGLTSRSLKRVAIGGVAVVLLLSVTVREIDSFAARPTTPLSVVSSVGKTFSELAGELGISDPLLAHHDAGAISYDRSVRLLDLGGLVDRSIAKNMNDRQFLEEYVLEQHKPDFVFGAVNFAAGTRFWDTPEFFEDYLRLEFADQPVMASDLSYIRSDRVRETDRVRVIPSDGGKSTKVVVLPNVH